jgi:hypothetical protein
VVVILFNKIKRSLLLMDYVIKFKKIIYDKTYVILRDIKIKYFCIKSNVVELCVINVKT